MESRRGALRPVQVVELVEIINEELVVEPGSAHPLREAVDNGCGSEQRRPWICGGEKPGIERHHRTQRFSKLIEEVSILQTGATELGDLMALVIAGGKRDCDGTTLPPD